MLYSAANKSTIKPCLKHLSNELHVFERYMQAKIKNTYEKNIYFIDFNFSSIL